MADAERTPLQEALSRAIEASGKTAGRFDALYQQRTGKSGKPVYDIMRGESRRPQPETLRAIAEIMDLHPESFVEIVHPSRSGADVETKSTDVGDLVDTVGIQHIDMAYGLGATFAVDHPEVEVLQFPVQWIRTITHSPPAMLTWTRGKGDSMEPTIRDGDLVLLDRSQRALTERDAMWAFTIGEEAAIKRLRRQGERCQILSDNASVPADEQNLRDMNIVGRVVFVGSRK